MNPRDLVMRGLPLALAALLGAGSAARAAPRPEHHRHARTHHHHHHRVQRGLASYYSARAAGKTTASGKPLHPGKLTAASKTLPLGTKAKVTNVKTGKSVKVTVTDRGPFVKNRIIDVSPKAATKLGMKDDGVAPVKVKPLEVPASDKAEGGSARRR